jgi:hypothetical protein
MYIFIGWVWCGQIAIGAREGPGKGSSLLYTTHGLWITIFVESKLTACLAPGPWRLLTIQSNPIGHSMQQLHAAHAPFSAPLSLFFTRGRWGSSSWSFSGSPAMPDQTRCRPPAVAGRAHYSVAGRHCSGHG